MIDVMKPWLQDKIYCRFLRSTLLKLGTHKSYREEFEKSIHKSKTSKGIVSEKKNQLEVHIYYL